MAQQQQGSEPPVPSACGIEKAVSIRDIADGKNDVAYWLSQPPAARIAAMEQIRSEYHQWRYGAQPGFQRVYRIVELEPG